jgi:hypothetical protein
MKIIKGTLEREKWELTKIHLTQGKDGTQFWQKAEQFQSKVREILDQAGVTCDVVSDPSTKAGCHFIRIHSLYPIIGNEERAIQKAGSDLDIDIETIT